MNGGFAPGDCHTAARPRRVTLSGSKVIQSEFESVDSDITRGKSEHILDVPAFPVVSYIGVGCIVFIREGCAESTHPSKAFRPVGLATQHPHAEYLDLASAACSGGRKNAGL